ncbi:Gcv operon activator [Pragia fontium]|uniref:LysR family transcriptional regulator, D-serine deaminase activator n=2 Tax=Pragia fontium TaxID=82985 RepID=A0AAJ4WCX4_9GAMM|nr:DNA-binding transcriptional regulator DsdC [Pragia fontium]GKX63701.1 DNA-binding transcriptional regulator DsdC [Pragia fontium]SFD31131.1 LysR family transcriptional regulator, D-serine deaminase activator [Pragia fontium DSM 5563 = ATCC 49100]SUB80899.1 Gcv operon activator [Pragia fontium]
MYTENHYIVGNRRLNGYQLSKLHTFEAAARHCSFALAADELSLSPSAVSHRINHLEEELGFKLFQRFHRKIELTDEGQRVYWALKSSLEYLNQEILEIKNQELSGSLTVYSRPSIAQCWLVPKLADFIRQYPSINLNILTGNENVNFRGYGIDLAIYFDDKTSNKLACQHLMDESMVPVCSPEYAEKYQLMGNITHLKQCTLLHDRQAWSNDSDTDEWSSWAKHFDISLDAGQHNMGFDRSDLAIIAAINHAGVAMGRKKLVNKRLNNNELVMPFPEMEVQCAQRYYISTLPERQDPKINAFIQWLESMAEKQE